MVFFSLLPSVCMVFFLLSSVCMVFFSSLLCSCVRGEGGGVAQTCHDDRVVELKEQLVVEEVQEGTVKEEGRDRVKVNAPWMTWR